MTDLLGGLTVREKDRVGTILRIHGSLFFKGQSVNADHSARWGIHLATDDAFAAAALPDPIGDSDSAWMINKFVAWDRGQSEYLQDEVDIRSKRKLLSSKMTIFFSIENLGANAADFSFGFRTLFSWK